MPLLLPAACFSVAPTTACCCLRWRFQVTLSYNPTRICWQAVMGALNGNDVPGLLDLDVFAVKAAGCVLSRMAALAVGVEGPMVHLGACMASGMCRAEQGEPGASGAVVGACMLLPALHCIPPYPVATSLCMSPCWPPAWRGMTASNRCTVLLCCRAVGVGAGVARTKADAHPQRKRWCSGV